MTDANVKEPPEWFVKALREAWEEDLIQYFKMLNFQVHAGLEVTYEKFDFDMKKKGWTR